VSGELRVSEQDNDIATELDADDGTSPAPEGQAYLVVEHEGRFTVERLLEGRPVAIGRAADAHFVIDNPRVSLRHARITLTDGRIEVADLGSRNGTKLDAAVLRNEARYATSGSVVQIGPTRIVIARTDRPLSYASEAARRRPEPEARDDGARRDSVPPSDEAVVVADPAMRALDQVISRISSTSATVLIIGETGVGKEVVAEKIHRASSRARRPFVRLNCASLPEGLLESELFGHEKGAFTGADRRRLGYFQAANQGTLLLDEIGEMPLPLQAKLLRVLEQRTLTRLGGTEEVAVDVRILCATHRDLAEEVAAGRFRQDLFYRISTFTLEVPPLRARPTEILLLADMFVRRFASGSPPALTAEVTERLLAHAWPGNVRELRNAIEHAVVMADGAPIRVTHLPRAVRGGASSDAAAPIRDRVQDVERAAIVAALTQENDNRTRAAKRLGMSRRALIYKMIKYGLRDDDGRESE
jgi:DNA-binding NtrC family response regulator